MAPTPTSPSFRFPTSFKSSGMWPFKSSTKPRWQPVTQSESDTESQSGEKQPLGPTDYSDDSSSTAGLEYQSHGNPTPRRWTTAYLASMLILSLLVNVGTYIRDRRFDLGQACTEMTNINWSPITEEHKMTYSTMMFNESLFVQDVYRKEPSPEVDESWAALGLHLRASVIDEDRAAKANLGSGFVKRLGSQGGGYLVSVEALHNLHCLNVLRQTSYIWNDYYRENRLGVWVNSETLVKLHIGHCIDDLRQQLMCTADLGLVPQVWVNTTSFKTFPYFNNAHKCRDFEMVRSWAEDNQIGEGDLAEFHEGDMLFDHYE